MSSLMISLAVLVSLSACEEEYGCQDDCADHLEGCLDGCSTDECEELCKEKHGSCMLGCDNEGY